jgi:hypothetical protein
MAVLTTINTVHRDPLLRARDDASALINQLGMSHGRSHGW